MNSITVSGRIGNIERKNIGGTDALVFSVADNWFKKGEKMTNWWNCTLFGKRADSLSWLEKGKQVAVSGTIQQNEGSDGKKYYNLTVNDIEVFADGKASGEKKTESKGNDNFDDDIPF